MADMLTMQFVINSVLNVGDPIFPDPYYMVVFLDIVTWVVSA